MSHDSPSRPRPEGAPDLHAFAGCDGAMLEVWRCEELGGAACVLLDDGHGHEASGVLERGEAVAVALHLLRVALGPEVAEQARRVVRGA